MSYESHVLRACVLSCFVRVYVYMFSCSIQLQSTKAFGDMHAPLARRKANNHLAKNHLHTNSKQQPSCQRLAGAASPSLAGTSAYRCKARRGTLSETGARRQGARTTRFRHPTRERGKEQIEVDLISARPCPPSCPWGLEEASP